MLGDSGLARTFPSSARVDFCPPLDSASGPRSRRAWPASSGPRPRSEAASQAASPGRLLDRKPPARNGLGATLDEPFQPLPRPLLLLGRQIREVLALRVSAPVALQGLDLHGSNLSTAMTECACRMPRRGAGCHFSKRIQEGSSGGGKAQATVAQPLGIYFLFLDFFFFLRQRFCLTSAWQFGPQNLCQDLVARKNFPHFRFLHSATEALLVMRNRRRK